MTTKPKILVTAAAGHVGSASARLLVDMGYPVRAFVRRKDQRSDALESAGVEIFVGDMRDFRDLRRALNGVQRAFHCPPFSADTLYDAALFAVAAEEAKLEAVALMGAFNQTPDHASISQRGHWIANQIYRWMPSVDTIHISPGLFAFPYFLGLPAVAHFGQLVLPLGNGRNAPPSNEDIARLVAHTLIDPARHAGKAYRPTGPRLIAPDEVADIMGQILGRKVVYKDVDFRTFQKAAQAMGFPTVQIAHIRHYVEEARAGAYETGAPTNDVELVTGTPAEPFAETAERYIREPHLIHPGLNIGTKAAAFRMLVRMMVARPIDLDAWERDRGYPMLEVPLLAHDNPEWRTHASQGKPFLLPDRAAGLPSRAA